MKYIEFETLPSTSLYIKENINNIDEGTYIIAKNQTAGRGRTGNSWISSCDNLMFSFKLKPVSMKVEDYPLITLLVGLAVRNTLSKIVKDENILIKWPNDIIIQNKKVCGIIAEGIFKEENYIIIGIGINVNQTEFTSEIKNKASSLKIIYNNEFDRYEILKEFDKEFGNLINKLEANNKNFIEEVDRYNYLKGKEVKINNDKYNNQIFICESINSNGNLVLKDNNEITFEINSNEVTLNNIYK